MNDKLLAVVAKPWSDFKGDLISCWISPQGDIYPCEHMEHFELAKYFVEKNHLKAAECDDPCDILHARGWARVANFPSVGIRIVPPTPYYKLNKRQWDLVACYGYDEFGTKMHR